MNNKTPSSPKEIPNETPNELPTMFGGGEVFATDISELREELTRMAEAGDIKYTTKHIKKSNRNALERIKKDFNRKQTDEANELISDNIIAKISELMKSLEMVEEHDKMEKELRENKLVKRDLKNIIGYVTPHVPLIGLLCGGVIVGKHVISNRHAHPHETDTQENKTHKINTQAPGTDTQENKTHETDAP